MSWLKDNIIYVIFTYISVLFATILVKQCYLIRNFNYLYISLLFFTAAILFWGCSTILNKKALKILFLVSLLACTAAYYYANFKAVNNFIIKNVVNKAVYINSLVAQGIETSFQDYRYIFLIIIPLFTIILLFLATKGLPNSILVFTLAVTTTLWYFGYTEQIKKNLFYYILISLCTYCVNGFLRNIKRLSRNGIKASISSWKIFIYIILTSTTIALITNVLPQEYNGSYVSDIRSRIYNKYAKPVESPEEKGKKLVYDLSYSGYDNNKKKLGGPVMINRLVAFRVKSDQGYHLRGAVKDLYDGFSWDKQSEEYNIKQPEMSTSFFNDEFTKNFIGSSSMLTIYPEELNTSTMFTPTLVYMAAISDNSDIYFDKIPTLMSGGNITKPYDVFFYNLNTEGLRAITSGNNFKSTDMSKDNLMENHKSYLQLPENISQRTYDLVNDIIKNKATNFEKVHAIRDFLRENYKYSLDVSNVPDDQEFLDYFLFTEKKGYCTYFATAETIMCRIAGIPARYVEGFNMSPEKDDEGNYVVRNENAHAWAEVLFMESDGDGLWHVVDAVPDAIEMIRKEEEEKKKEEQTNLPNTLPQTQGNKDMGIDEDIAAEADSELRGIYLIALRILSVGAALIVFHLLLLALHWGKKTRLISNSSVIPIYKYSIERLENVGIKSGIDIGDLEFTEKLHKDIKKVVKEAASLAYREYFGEKQPIEFNKDEYYNIIEKYVRMKQNDVVYFVKKYYFIKKISLIKYHIMLLYKKIKNFKI